MNRNSLIAFIVTAAVLGLLAFAAWSFLEVYPKTKWVPPSREAQINEYLALDRWLESEGHQVRLESSGNLSMISKAEERQIFIQSSLFRWTEEAIAFLIDWIADGGRLFLALDVYYKDWNFAGLWPLLDKFGIDLAEETADLPHYRNSALSPGFDRNASFVIDEAEDAFSLKDWTGSVRLVSIKRGMGEIIVSANPRFLRSLYLGREPNSRLAWAIFAANEGDWFFIRGVSKTQGFFGSLFRQGNLIIFAVSVIVLLIVSFWAVIPVFGLVEGDNEKPGKTLRERFLAEGRFYRKYGALDGYRDRYIKEIKRKLTRKDGILSDEEIIKQSMVFFGKQDQLLLEKIFKGEYAAYRDFPKTVKILKTILERI